MLGMDAIAAKIGLTAEDILPYGRDKAKVPLEVLDRPGEDGTLVLVTAMTPTPAGEGKTTTTIGLVQALEALGERAAAALREPSLGPCFGVKGGGTGGGQSKLVPTTDINLHFTGDIHAVTAAHNLISALVDNHLHFRKSPTLDPRRIVWKRVIDQNDRALREVMVGMNGEGVTRQTGFDISAASEIMAILCLSSGVDDLRARVARTLVGFTTDRKPVTVDDLDATGAVVALLRDALLPNLVQTTQGTPAFVHGGPFANIAHGCNSILATRMALKTNDWVCTEAGFGSDLGAEKFFHIACRAGGFDPHVVVLVATIRALKWHGGATKDTLDQENVEQVRSGLSNLAGHLDNLRAFGKPVVIAINKFHTDTDAEIAVVAEFGERRDVRVALADHFARGGEGAKPLAHAVMQAVAENDFTPMVPAYTDEMSMTQKLDELARRVYGARGVVLASSAKNGLKRIERLGLSHLPVCMAKTQSSLSDDPKRRGRPEAFDIHVRGLQISAGAGFIVALAGDLLRMPGLPRVPSAGRIDLIDGNIVGVG